MKLGYIETDLHFETWFFGIGFVKEKGWFSIGIVLGPFSIAYVWGREE